jgi:hypothetical protein
MHDPACLAWTPDDPDASRSIYERFEDSNANPNEQKIFVSAIAIKYDAD